MPAGTARPSGARAGSSSYSSMARALPPPPKSQASPALWVLVWLGTAGGFMIGYSDGPGATFMPSLSSNSLDTTFLRNNGATLDPISCHFSNTRSQAYIVLKPAASTVSALLMAFLARRLGRKHTLSIGAGVYVLACVTQAFQPNEAQVFAGRALVGVAEGLLMTVYVGAVELGNKYNRGTLASLDAVGRGLGVLCQGMLIFGLHKTGPWGWCVYALFGAAFGAFVFCLLTFGGLPDTPASLVQRGKLEEARESLQMLRNPLLAAETEAEYQGLLRECASTEGPFARRWLPRTGLALGLAFAYNLLGGLLTKYNMPAILVRTVAVDSIGWAYLLFMILLGGGSLVGALLALATSDRVGRRKMLTIICACNVVLCAVGGSLVASAVSYSTRGGQAVMLIVLALISASHTAGPQAIVLLYASEIQPLSNRLEVYGAAVALVELGQVAVQTAAIRTSCSHTHVGLFIFMGLNVVCGALMWALLPETARLDSDEIDRAFGRHWLWGRFTRPAAAAAAARGKGGGCCCGGGGGGSGCCSDGGGGNGGGGVCGPGRGAGAPAAAGGGRGVKPHGGHGARVADACLAV